MADLKDTISFEIQSGTKSVDNGISKLINDLKDLRNGMDVSEDSVASISNQFKQLGVNLSSSKLKSSISSVNSDLLRYVNSSGQVVTVNRKVKNGLDTYTVSLKNMNNELKEGVSLWSAFTKGISGAIVKFRIIYDTISNLAYKMADIIESASEYEEALNLFLVSMGDQAEEATAWVERFSTALYLDPANVMQYMGSLNSLISGLGVGADKSYLMSKNLTQLAYDLASFKNMKFEEAFTKLQSGISGEIEPLRNVGVALSQNTLQELANSLGIQQRVAEMSEAEKAQLRYIQIIKSTTQWQGDMGRTLVSPANAVRVLQEQFALLGRAVGRVFLPIIMKTIPYVMALTEILTDLANRLASFFGYEFTDIDYSSLGNISTGLGDIGDEAEETTKKLNTMLAPFDELNVVQTKSAGSGSGASLGGDLGLDLPEYDALAGLTDDFEKNVESAKKNLQKLWSVAKKLVAIFGTLWATTKLIKFMKYLKDVKTLFTGLKTPTSTLSGLFKTLITRFSDGYKYSKFMGESGLKSVLAGTQNLLSPFAKLGLTLSGVVVSFSNGYKNMKEYAQGDGELRNSLLETIGVVGTFAGATALLVNPWAGLGVAISGVIGAVKGYYDGIHELEVLNSVFDNQGIHIESLSSHFTTLFDESTKYVSSIDNLSDKYSSAKETMTTTRNELDLFIESLYLQDGVITDSQIDELRKQYTNLKEETNNTNTASQNYYIALIKSSGNARNATEEDIASQIASYKALSSEMAGYEQSYLDEEERLTLARYTGKMSVDEYNEAIKKLKIEYGYLADTSFDAEGAISNFSTSLGDINYSSVETLNEQVGKTKDKYNETITTLEEYKTKLKTTNEEANQGYLDRIKNLETSIKLHGDADGSIQATIDKLREYVNTNNSVTTESIKNVDDTIKKIQGEYKGYLATIYGDLTTQGADTVKKFSGTMSSIKKELNSLKDVDLSGTGKAMYDSLENSILGSGNSSLIIKLRDAMKKVGVAGRDELMNFITPSEALREETKNKYTNLGEDIMNGTTGGVENKRQEFIDVILDASDRAQQSFEKANKIKSPSRVYAGYGRYIVEGLVMGINDNKQLAVESINTLSKEMNKSMSSIQFNLNTSSFENSLNTLLGKLQTFADKFRSGVNSLMSSFTTTMNGIKVGNDNKLYYTKLPYVKIPKFEDGGYPTSGDLFYANENGIPEMVGRIGNQTAVANNDQITTAITNALMSALNNSKIGTQKPGTTVVNIGGRKVYEGVGDYVDSENDRYGTSYVHI